MTNPEDDQILLVVDRESIGIRLDKYIANAIDDLTRSTVQRLIEQGAILRNDAMTRAAEPLKLGDRISVRIPEYTVITQTVCV